MSSRESIAAAKTLVFLALLTIYFVWGSTRLGEVK
jgi:hypothetical protein